LAFLGLPTLAIIVADNQRPIAEALHAQGIVHNLGWYTELSPATIAQTLTALLTNEARRAEMSQRGQALVDGDGAERIVMHLRGDPLRLRPAHESDCCLLWEWANDPEVRGASFNSDPIPWEEHVRWFAAKYHTPDTTIYIALDASDTPIGQVRFDRTGQNEAVVSISIDHYQRGKGYGKALLNLSAERLFSTWTISRIHSYIKQGNTASVRAFEQAGYQHVEPTEVQRYPAYHLMLYNHNRALKA
jgi:RimJ/RimL family protein N-acetyltransferase